MVTIRTTGLPKSVVKQVRIWLLISWIVLSLLVWIFTGQFGVALILGFMIVAVGGGLIVLVVLRKYIRVGL
jgi:hypothetical protein